MPGRPGRPRPSAPRSRRRSTASMSTSPDTVSTEIWPLTSRRRTSPEDVRNRWSPVSPSMVTSALDASTTTVAPDRDVDDEVLAMGAVMRPQVEAVARADAHRQASLPAFDLEARRELAIRVVDPHDRSIDAAEPGVARAEAEREEPGHADLVLDRRAGVDPSSSWRPPEGPDRGRGVLGADLVASERARGSPVRVLGGSADAAGDVGRGVVEVVGVRARPEAEGADERLDAGADRRVADAELPLHVAEVAARAEEALEQGELVAVRAGRTARR